jgi:hypothetical protein
MTRLALALVVGSLGFASNALAQAPGEGYYGPSAAPVVQPTPVVVVPVGRDPMAQRWAVGLNFGGLSVGPEDAPDDMQTDFATAELNVRFRATRRLEVFLAFAGGRQTVEDYDGEQMDGDLAMDQVTLGLRFNFRPAHNWNWYLMGGFGSTLIAHHETPEELREDLRRPHGMFGIGVERRWTNFALQAELRGVAIGENEDRAEIQPDIAPGGPRDPNAIDFSRNNEELGGGQFSLGASFYF